MKHRLLLLALISPALMAAPTGPVYDKEGHLTSYVNADGGSDEYTYDDAWRLVKFVSRNGETTSFKYREDGSMVSEKADGSTAGI